MKTIVRFTLLFIGLFYITSTQAQFSPDKICRIENGHLVFAINLKWSLRDQKELMQLFDLDSTLIAQVFSGKSIITGEYGGWKVKKVKPNIVELSKPVDSKNDKNIKINDLFLEIDEWRNFGGNTEDVSVVYGVNDFKLSYVFTYNKIKAQFYLPAFKTAGKIFLSGSFNGWSTALNPMKRVKDSWITDINLKPGKYTYKFIIDGKWTEDPNNNLREDDGADGHNSVVYCCNHLFKLNGYKGARNVVVTGNFCNWNPDGISMHKTDDGWSVPVYLRNGTYAYKFITDEQWITDPGNPIVRKDGDGNLNSLIGIGEPYLFKLDGYSKAREVVLTGSFNGWNHAELVMDKTEKGWQLPYVIAPGNYEYKFIVDGDWITDPANPITTQSGDQINSFIALKANHLFELNKFQKAKSVIVSGSFNGWNTQGYKMTRQGEKWILPLFLAPGKYTYKFIVDGTWILDPDNSLYEQNEYNTNNSVLWIEP